MGKEKMRKEMRHHGHYSYIESVGNQDQGTVEQRFDEHGLKDVSATWKGSRGRRIIGERK